MSVLLNGYVCCIHSCLFIRAHVLMNRSIRWSITYSHWALTKQSWYSGFYKHTHRAFAELSVKQTGPGLTAFTLRDLWQERGESNSKLYRSRLETPLRPHTHINTHTLQLCWINACSAVKDRAIQRGTPTDTHSSPHTYTLSEIKEVLGIREPDKGQQEHHVSSDLNSLIWHPAICNCSMEQMLTLRDTSLHTHTQGINTNARTGCYDSYSKYQTI